MCIGCPIQGKKELYAEAGKNPELARKLSPGQGIPDNLSDEVKMKHFESHAQTYVAVICEKEKNCRKYSIASK